jgi:cobalt-zinc-cadmium efflux system membrane fusion protein
MNQRKLLFLLSLLILVACSHKEKNEATGNAMFKVDNDIITVADDAPLLRSIKTGEATTVDFSPSLTVSGEVKPLPACYAEIATPFAGRIVKSYVQAGQRIAAGSPVFEISSPDFSEAVKNYQQARQEFALAEKAFARTKSLREHSAASVKELEEAQTGLELKKKELEQSHAAIKLWVADTENLQAGQPLIVRSPIAGEVVKAEITIGQYVRDDADALVAVTDINRVRVLARVREKDIPLVQNVASVEVSPVTQPELKIAGKLTYTGAVIDPESRTADLIVECDNPRHELKPNMFTSVMITADSRPLTAVPSNAVLQSEDSRYVIVCESENRFHKTDVSVVSETGGQAMIASGLQAGARIVTEGAFYFVEAR